MGERMKIEYNHVDESTTNRIGYVRTKEPICHNTHMKPKEVFIGDTTLSNIIDRIVAVADSMNALAEELRKTMDKEG